MKPSKKTLAKLKAEIHINAVRLFCDGCDLFRRRSYASAYAMAILSLEELGKLEMVDHICDDICVNPDTNPQDFLDSLFSRRMFFSHRNKQVWASAPLINYRKKRIRDIDKGGLDRAKQNSFYVGYSNRRIQSPRRVSSSDAFAELSISFNKIKEVEDLGFNGFQCLSDARSRAQGKHYYEKAAKAFKMMRKP